MAFIFVPNADGSFTEGDKQTNPDTGVEYIYTDGAWRALGPKIEDEFVTLDDRYVKLDGTSIVGDLYRLRGPNSAGTGFNSFQNISDGEQRLYNMALPEDSNTGWAASVQYVQNYVQNAVGNVDLSEYLPLTGGDMTGDINMKNCRLDTFNAAGEQTMEIAPSGFIKTRDMLRVVRDDGGPILEGRTSDSASDITVKIDSDGYYQFRGRGELYGDIYLKTGKQYIVQGPGNTTCGRFYAPANDTARIEAPGKTLEVKDLATPVDAGDAVSLGYLNGLPYATEDYVNTATEHDLTDQGQQDLDSTEWKVIQKNQDGNNRTFINIYDGEMNLYNVADPSDGADGWATNKKYVKDNFIGNKGTQTLDADSWNIRQPNSNGDNRNFIVIHNGEMKLFHVADPTNGDDAWAANKKYVNDVAAEYLPLAGGNLTGDVESTGKFVIDHGTGNTASKKLHIIGETADGTGEDLFWSYKNADGTPDAVNYKGKIENDFNLVNKSYVDDAIAAGSSGGGVVIHGTTTPPANQDKGTLLLTSDNKFYIYV